TKSLVARLPLPDCCALRRCSGRSPTLGAYQPFGFPRLSLHRRDRPETVQRATMTSFSANRSFS
ncbi:MAG TPA: hypothetical protein VMU08_03945, partial [Rhizomicrobium sp.]|nr:hypothetical protein [Rhizomicrobium sp.]